MSPSLFRSLIPLINVLQFTVNRSCIYSIRFILNFSYFCYYLKWLFLFQYETVFYQYLEIQLIFLYLCCIQKFSQTHWFWQLSCRVHENFSIDNYAKCEQRKFYFFSNLGDLIPISCLVLARTFTILNRNSNSRNSCQVPYFRREAFKFLPVSVF